MKTGLSQRQLQLQKLSPQQIQLMKLLQIPTATLDQRIKEELEANPALEEPDFDAASDFQEDDFKSEEEYNKEESFELDEYLTDYIEDDPSSYKLQVNNYSADEDDKTIPIAVETSFYEHLDRQVSLLELQDETEQAIVEQIIGSIDEDGYLRREPIAIVDDLMFSRNIFVTEEQIRQALKKVQSLDPSGVGARDLQECLVLQIDSRLEQEEYDDEELEALQLARKILCKYFDGFSKKHYDKLQRQLDISEEQLKEAIGEIVKLNPKPASGFSSGSSQRNTQYVIPDFIIRNQDGELMLTLNNRNAPELQVSHHFQDMLRSYQQQKKNGKVNKQTRETVRFVKQKIESARWFIDAIQQRYDTMYRCMYAILQYQYDFFLTGDERKLRPMILQDIADITALDVSTVSRVANSKFVQTEFGTKRLKDFFSEAMQTSDGEEVSTLEVKNILSEVVAKEDKRKPLSDEKLKNILKEKGYNIARRTVAKYRDQLSIPKASLRKEL